MFGFSGDRYSECGGCVTRCEAMATTEPDTEVFACLDAALTTRMCGAGITGFSPWASAVNECCQNRTDSPFCVDTCQVLLTNDLGAQFFPSCAAL